MAVFIVIVPPALTIALPLPPEPPGPPPPPLPPARRPPPAPPLRPPVGPAAPSGPAPPDAPGAPGAVRLPRVLDDWNVAVPPWIMPPPRPPGRVVPPEIVRAVALKVVPPPM